MTSFLDKILSQKQLDVSRLRGQAGSFKKRTSPRRPFIQALDRRPRLAVIAEVKKASPSKGLICRDFDPVATAKKYELGGAGAVSVLTDEKFFQGHAEHLTAVREHVALPVLRKDFIIDTLQVEETAHLNADAMLLIAEALEAPRLADLYQAAVELDVEPFIEVHSAEQLDKVMRLGPKVIGVNNRDLFTFKTDLGTTRTVITHIPSDIIVVSESGVGGRADAELLRDAGVRALLVGESLMRAGDAGALIRELAL